MRERQISTGEIKKVITNPEKIYRENGRVIASGKINKKTLEIV